MMRPLLLENLKQRSLVMELTRDFFRSMGFIEVETPLRCPSIIPEAHIDPMTSQGAYLQASPELCMKRLLARGADRIFRSANAFVRMSAVSDICLNLRFLSGMPSTRPMKTSWRSARDFTPYCTRLGHTGTLGLSGHVPGPCECL